MLSTIRDYIVNKKIFIFLILTISISPVSLAMKPANGHKNKARKSKNSKPRKPLSIKQQKNLNAQLVNGVIHQPSIITDNIKSLLASRAQVNARDSDGRTILMKAANLGHDDACQLLIRRNAGVNKQDNNGCTALMATAKNGHDSLCELLIQHGAQIDTKNNDGYTALMLAAQGGHVSTIKLIIDHGAQIDTQSNDGQTALFLATRSGHASIGKILLDRGAQFDTKCLGFTALQRAVANGDELMIRTLITSYSTFSPENEFKISRQRIWTALCVFKRSCPLMPKDIRKLILYFLPELASDVGASGAFGSYKNLTEAHAVFAPLPIVRILIKKEKLNLEETIAAIKAHQFDRISVRLSECFRFAYPGKIQVLIHPNNFRKNFAAAIEWNIRRRLRLPLTWAESAATWIPKSCSVQ